MQKNSKVEWAMRSQSGGWEPVKNPIDNRLLRHHYGIKSRLFPTEQSNIFEE